MSQEIEPIQAGAEVTATPRRAFELWTTALGEWWPASYSFNGDALRRIEVEPTSGGHCIEEGGSSGRIVWGQVLEIDPPRRLLISWQISPDRSLEPGPESASQLALSFHPQGEGTAIELEHREFARHGDGAAGYREAMAGEQGWPWLLELFSAAAA